MLNRTIFVCFALVCLSSAARADWKYSEELDQMTSKATKHATLASTNSLSLGFPYRGENYGVLQIRQHPKYGLDVIVSVQKGQVLCRSYDGCSVSVRFDDQAPVVFSGVGPADHGSTSVFLRPELRFISLAKKAKRVLVQLSFYQSGEQVLSFETGTPLVWGAAAGGALKPKK